jgi:hypothetical protein
MDYTLFLLLVKQNIRESLTEISGDSGKKCAGILTEPRMNEKRDYEWPLRYSPGVWPVSFLKVREKCATSV